MFCKKSVITNFTKFTGNHLCLRPATLLKETLAQVFSCEFCEISKNTFFIEHLWWLLLWFRETYPEPSRISKKGFFANLLHDWKRLILDVWLSFKCASGMIRYASGSKCIVIDYSLWQYESIIYCFLSYLTDQLGVSVLKKRSS